METLQVRIIRFESAGQLADESEGYFLAFAAATPEVFSEAHRLVRSLPMWQRAWLPMAQVWWVHEDGLSYLARRIPDLQMRLWQVAHDRTRMAGSPGARRLVWTLAPRHVRDAFAALSLRCDADADEVKAAYRARAKKTHPDMGGSHAAMLALNAAYKCAFEWAVRMHPARAEGAAAGVAN